MPFASELMDREPLTVQVELPVPDLARLLLSERLDGVCVVKDGRCVGVVTTMDLIFQEKRVHLPSFVTVMEMVLPVGNRQALKELEKVTGSVVRDIMTADPVTVSFDASLALIATLMVEQHLTLLPVVNGGRLVGVVTKPDVLRAAFVDVTQEEADTDKVRG